MASSRDLDTRASYCHALDGMLGQLATLHRWKARSQSNEIETFYQTQKAIVLSMLTHIASDRESFKGRLGLRISSILNRESVPLAMALDSWLL